MQAYKDDNETLTVKFAVVDKKNKEVTAVNKEHDKKIKDLSHELYELNRDMA